jgi:hypothetical protein
VESAHRMRRHGPAGELDRLQRPPQRLLDCLRPLDFSDPKLGIRRSDVDAFREVAAMTETVIVLRSTNPRSLPFIGVKGYTPKPLDCKAKTAMADDVRGAEPIDCAGLVVDPNRVSPKVFGDRAEGANEYWRMFLRTQQRVKVKDGVEIFLRHGGKGFYAVDTSPPSTLHRHHGCLMLSAQDAPPDFDPRSSHTRVWMERHMAYVHGDYDLYAVVDVAAVDRGRGVNVQAVQRDEILGLENWETERTPEVRERLNAAIGCAMVQHGEQVAVSFSGGDTLYVFAPDKSARVIRPGSRPEETAAMLKDLFRYVFATEIGD